ncbi:hypothetical protein ACQEV4_29030 [Streptomyces shenzhenensis]|uniref:hypothetical protein n=1 Tax=Streptomyces shenzhenensis TaxID=943815 RepID=UPI003D8CF454
MTVNVAFSKLSAVLLFLIPECAAVTETEQTPVVILVTPVRFLEVRAPIRR